MPSFNIDQNQILQWVDTGLLIAFIVVIAGVLLSFLRGLLRGWKHGTYNFVVLGVIAGVLFALIPVFVNVVGNIDLRAWLPESMTITQGDRSFTWHITTVFESAYNFVYGLLHDLYQVKASPEAIANYSIAIAGSAIRLVLVFAIAFITLTIGSFLVWLLWHIAFKHIIPKEKRKPRLRFVSGLEDMVAWVVLSALMIIPFSGIANAIHNNGSLPKESDNETIALVNKVLDTYDNSIFNKALFAWTKGSGKDTLDTRIAEFFAANTYATEGFSVEANAISEIRVVAGLEGGIVGWMFGGGAEDGGVVTSSMSTAAVIGEFLYDLAAARTPELLNGLVPLTLDIGRHIDSIQEDLGGYKLVDATAMKAAYRRIANSEYVSSIEDVTRGEFALASYDDSCPYSEATLAEVNQELEHDPEAKDAVNAIVSGYVLGQLSGNPDWSEGPMSALLPQSEEAISSIDWWKEANVFHAVSKAVEPFRAGEDSLVNDLKTRFLEALARDPGYLIELLVGPRNASGEPEVDGKGRSNKDICLLDSDLVALALPAALEVGAHYLSDYVLDEHDPDISAPVGDLAVKLQGEATKDSRVNFKRELGAILDVLGKVALTDVGKEFIRNFESHPGLDFAADGTLIHFDSRIAIALQDGVSAMDRSQLMTLLVPTIGDHFMRPIMQDGVFAEMGLAQPDFHCDKLGAQIADLLSIGVYCNDMVSSIGGMFKTEGESIYSVNSLLDSLNSLETAEGHYQVTHLLDIVTKSPIFNPVVTVGEKTYGNYNITALLNYLFRSFNTETPIELDFATLSEVKMDSNWKNGEELDFDKLGENYFILRAFKELTDPGSGVFALLTELEGASSAKAIAALSRVNVESLFDKIGDSITMRAVLPPLFDKFLIGTLMNGDSSMDLSAMGVTYKNLVTPDDWEQEGVSMQAILNLASRGLDISKLDFLSSSTVTLLRRLSQSRMFFAPDRDENGNLVYDSDGNVVYSYVFPRFVEDKLLLSLGTKDALELFVDYPDLVVELDGHSDTIANHLTAYTDWDKKESLDRKKAICSVFVRSLHLLSEPEQWDAEFDRLSLAFDALAGAGGLEKFDSIDASTIPSLRIAVFAINGSNAFGPTILSNLFSRALNGNAMPAELRGDGTSKPNVGWFYRNALDYVKAVEEGTPSQSIVEARTHELTGLMNLVSSVLGNDAIKDEHGNLDLSFAKLDVEGFLRPTLLACHASKVFNPQTAEDMYGPAFPVPATTVFENLLLSFMTNSGVYVDDSGSAINDGVTPVKGSTRTLGQIVQGVTDWNAEIESICELVSLLQHSSFLNASGQFDMSPLNDLAAYFGKEGAEQELSYLINSVQESALFYRCLAPKLDTAVQNGLGGITLPNIEDDIRCADFYYNKDASGEDFLPYSESEVHSLIRAFAKISNCMGIDLSDLSTLDADSLTEALVEMGRTGVFNSNKTKSETVFGAKADPLSRRSGLTAFQCLLCDVTMVNSLENYYYLAASPKDASHVSDYDSAKAKIVYEIPKLIPALSDPGVTPATYAEAAERVLANEWGATLSFLQQKQFADFISGAIAFEDLSEEAFTKLLHTLNECTLYRDCVPNAFYDALVVKGTIGITGVDFAAADIFFSYYHYDTVGSEFVFSEARSSTPNFDMPFYGPEIDHIGMLYSLLKANKDSMSSLSMATIDALTMRNVLLELHDSYVFHEAAKNARHPMDFVAAENQFHDLTVFEQFIYKICYDTTLYKTNYNIRADYAYALAHGDYGANHKMHDVILNLTTSSGSWLKEIEALTTDGLVHAGDDSDPIIGIVAAGKASGILDSSSSVGVDYEKLKSTSPKAIKTMLYALNECSLLSDALPYAVGDLLGQNDEGKGIGLDDFFSTRRSYSAYVGSSTFDVSIIPDFYLDGDLSSSFQGIDSILMPVSADPTGHYSVFLSDDANVTACVPMSYSAGNATFNTGLLPKGFRIVLDTGYTISGSVQATVDLSNYDIGHDGYRYQAISAIGHLLSSAYRGTAGGTRTDNLYFSFADTDNSTLTAFYDDVSDFPHSTYGFLALFGNSGFYDRMFDGSDYFTESGLYRAADVALYNALNFDVEVGVSIDYEIAPSVHVVLPPRATISIGNRIGKGTTRAEHLEAIHAILASATGFADYVREARWLDAQASNAGTYDVYCSYQNLVLHENQIGSVSINVPQYRYVLSSYIDRSFATTSGATEAMENILRSSSYDYSIVVPNDDADTTLYSETGASSRFGVEILASLATATQQNKADMVDIDFMTPTVMGGSSSYKYNRIGDHVYHVAEQPALFDDLYANSFEKLTENYLDGLAHSVAAMRLLYVEPSSITAAQKQDLALAFEAMGGESVKVNDLFYLASLYDRMVPGAHGFYSVDGSMRVTDFPIVGEPGRILNVETPWSYAAIASVIA